MENNGVGGFVKMVVKLFSKEGGSEIIVLPECKINHPNMNNQKIMFD